MPAVAALIKKPVEKVEPKEMQPLSAEQQEIKKTSEELFQLLRAATENTFEIQEKALSLKTKINAARDKKLASSPTQTEQKIIKETIEAAEILKNKDINDFNNAFSALGKLKQNQKNLEYEELNATLKFGKNSPDTSLQQIYGENSLSKSSDKGNTLSVREKIGEKLSGSDSKNFSFHNKVEDKDTTNKQGDFSGKGSNSMNFPPARKPSGKNYFAPEAKSDNSLSQKNSGNFGGGEKLSLAERYRQKTSSYFAAEEDKKSAQKIIDDGMKEIIEMLTTGAVE